jgi:CheY-like chemotaxis protein
MSKTVLLVDDEPNIRETISFILEMEGYDVITAVNGMEGLEKLREHRPKAILLDAMMPELDGFEMCREVKADPGLAHTLVIMLTAMGQKVDEERARESGADHFVTKPFDDDHVLGLLGQVFGD